MKQTIYIETKCSEELPKKSGEYISREPLIGWGKNKFKSTGREWYDQNGFRCEITFWLKPVQIDISEERIEDEAATYAATFAHDHLPAETVNALGEAYTEGFKAALTELNKTI